jgi:hypothetical protein
MVYDLAFAKPKRQMVFHELRLFLETASLHYHENLEWRTCHDKHNLICFDTITCQAIYLFVQNDFAI